MPRHARPRPAPVALVAAAVLGTGVAAAAVLGPAGAPEPPVAAAVTAPPSTAPPTSPAPAAVTALAVRPPAPAPAPEDAADPATWPARRLAAQLVFSCVQTSDLGTAAAHAQAGVGGVVLMGRPSDGPALTAALAGVTAAAPDGLPPLLASDEEGGLVQRLRDVLGPLPAAQEMGGWGDDRIEQTAFDYGTRMRALGIPMALSPVADLGTAGGYIAETRRAFSADPARVAGAAAAWARGLERAGVASAVKHWPGHGGAGDSHGTAPTVPPLPALEGADLPPFDAVVRAGASVVMVGHLRSDGLTEPGVPATLSPNAMRVLRSRIPASTVVLSDSVSMGAASAELGLRPADAAVRSLQAGADWVMSCVDPLAAVDALQLALDSGGVARDAAVASARRVLGLKHRLGLLSFAPATAPPTGTLQAEARAGLVRLYGWAGDPDGGPAPVRVTVAGAVVQETPGGPDGAFTAQVPAPSGAEVCAEALNTGPGRPTPLGCVTAP